MRISRLYVAETLAENCELQLEADKAHYVRQVLRLKLSANLILFDGSGLEFVATITELNKKSVRVSTGKSVCPAVESSLKTELIQAVAKPDHMDIAIRKAVELGITAIRPLLAERSQGHSDRQRLTKRLAHWRGIAISACEQSGRTLIPTIHEPQRLAELSASIGETQNSELRLLLHPGTSNKTEQADAELVRVAIGPEGGFTENEIQTLELAGFYPLALGPRILRTETAAIAAIAIIQSRYGDLNH